MSNKVSILFYIHFVTYFGICLIKDIFNLPNNTFILYLWSGFIISTLGLLYLENKTKDAKCINTLIVGFALVNETICIILRQDNDSIFSLIFLCVAFSLYFISFTYLESTKSIKQVNIKNL